MTGFSPATRSTIQNRAGNKCERCCHPIFDWSPREIHHRRPRAMGGSKDPLTNTPANGVLLCPACHRFIESHRAKALSLGWLMRQGQDPEKTPIYYQGCRWVTLSRDGKIHALAKSDAPEVG